MKSYKMVDVKLLSVTPFADEHIERCARVCYKSVEKTGVGIEFLKKLMGWGHTTIFEHASLTYELDISRVCSHQDIRHRIKSTSQESQRVVKIVKDNYVIPPGVLNKGPEAIMVFEDAWVNCHEAYCKLIDLGVKVQDARYIIPGSAKTKLANTCNFRELINVIFPQRIEAHAQWEIKSCYIMLLGLLLSMEGVNSTFKAFMELGFQSTLSEEVRKLKEQGFRFKYEYDSLEAYCYLITE